MEEECAPVQELLGVEDEESELKLHDQLKKQRSCWGGLRVGPEEGWSGRSSRRSTTLAGVALPPSLLPLPILQPRGR